MRIVLTGSDGQLGTDLTEVIPDYEEYELIPLTIKDMDVRDRSKMIETFSYFDPDVVINTAAYHNVDEVEDNPTKAFLVNSLAVRDMAEWCTSKDKTLIFISTDYVFGKDKNRKLPYVEKDVPAPINIYGLSKVVGEHFAVMCPKHYVVRTSGLFGVAGAMGKGGNFVETMLKLAKEKDEIKVVNDQTLSPTHTLDLARQIIFLLKYAPFGLYHAVSEGKCSWYGFAKEIFKITKTKINCIPIPSSKYPMRAKRPKYSVLSNSKLDRMEVHKMRHWKESLKDYLIEKGHVRS
jgi:dTDP-4-dehydrorhamnose reductase